jgi:hypothetical protein
MNGWNPKIEKNVKNLGWKSGAYRFMHDESSGYFSKLNNILSIITIVLITLTGTSSFTIAFLEEESSYKIIVGVVLYIIAALTSIKDFLNLTQISEKHKLYSIRFSALYHNIQRQMSLDQVDRQDGKDYVGWINSEFDSLLFSNPDIPSSVKSRISEKFGDVFSPDMLSDLSVVENIIEEEKSDEEKSDEEKSQDEVVQVVSEKNNNNKYSRNRYEIDRYMSSH